MTWSQVNSYDPRIVRLERWQGSYRHRVANLSIKPLSDKRYHHHCETQLPLYGDQLGMRMLCPGYSWMGRNHNSRVTRQDLCSWSSLDVLEELIHHTTLSRLRDVQLFYWLLSWDHFLVPRALLVASEVWPAPARSKNCVYSPHKAAGRSIYHQLVRTSLAPPGSKWYLP